MGSYILFTAFAKSINVVSVLCLVTQTLILPRNIKCSQEFLYFITLEIPITVRGPYCFNCDNVDDPKHCTNMTACSKDQVLAFYNCYIL